MKVASYDGGLVNYEGKIYYVNRSQIEALRTYVRWNLRKTITVIEDQDSASSRAGSRPLRAFRHHHPIPPVLFRLVQ